MSDPTADPARQRSEKGYLLIADMEDSTRCKYVLDESVAYRAVCDHNEAVLASCVEHPVPGVVLSSLGDSIVVKFPAGDSDAENAAALASCLRAARDVIAAVQALEPRATREGDGDGEFVIRTKLLLQYYHAEPYRWSSRHVSRQDEIMGPDIDAAFRMAAMSWRFQVLVTEKFARKLLLYSTVPSGEPGDEPPRISPAELLAAARRERDAAEDERAGAGIVTPLRLDWQGQTLDYWITDARTTARLHGVPGRHAVFLLALEDPTGPSFDPHRRYIKLRQDHHAMIMVKVAIDAKANDDYIDHVVKRLRDTQPTDALDSELTLCVAAKIYGPYDFFFRVSCYDEDSLHRLFETIQDDLYAVTSLEVRSTMPDHFEVNSSHAAILDHFSGKYQLVLAWFSPGAGVRLLDRFSDYMRATSADAIRDVEILEAGEVVHRTPVYALFVCRSLAAYSAFFREQGLNPTTCESYIAANAEDSPRPGVRLRYHLVNRIFLPRRQPRV